MEFYDLLLPETPGIVRMDGKPYSWNTSELYAFGYRYLFLFYYAKEAAQCFFHKPCAAFY